MYSFMNEQMVFEVGGVKFGGQPGVNPTVLFGTLFYGSMFKSLDNDSLTTAKNLVLSQEKLMDETGIPGLVDVYVRDVKHIEREVNLVLDSTDLPFAVDSSESETRIKTLEYLGKAGVLDRVVYNSLNLGVTEKELDALGRHTPAASVVLAYNPRDMSVDGRVDILQSGAGMLCVKNKGLLEVASDAGIENILLDSGATPFGSMSCETLRSLPVFKNQFGLPVGCALHNTLESWSWMKDRRQEGERDYWCADASANSLVPLCCGDFIFYGNITSAKNVYPSIAFCDKLMAEGAKDYFGASISDKHPYSRLP